MTAKMQTRLQQKDLEETRLEETRLGRGRWHARWRSRCAAGVILLAILLPGSAVAQQVTVVVGGEPITSYDIDQRSRFLELTAHKQPPRQEVVDELINDKLKLQVAKLYKLDITDSDVNTAFGNMGKRMRMSAEQLTQVLAQSGVDAATLKARIRAEIAWTQIVRGKFASTLQIGDKEIRDALLAQQNGKDNSGKDNKDDKDGKAIIQNSVENSSDDKPAAKGMEFTMRPILFIVPHGTSETGIEERKREAEGLRAQFDNCDSGLAIARQMRYVAVRDQIVRSSSDLVPALRQILDTTPVGHLTPPEVMDQGVQVFAICSKKETSGDTPEQHAVREKLFAQRYDEQSKRYLAELRRKAMIEVK
jgi:peptidyl-prolyl cis-trans isomerase SurA